MKLNKLFLAAAIVALPAAVQAQPVTGVYIGGGVGINQLLDTKVKTTPNTLKSDIGVVGLASVGYGFGNGLRAEIEGNYRWNNSRVTGLTTSGSTQQYGFMVNGLYDFNLGWAVYPYLGAGLGWQTTSTKAAGGTFDSDGYIAAQGIGGVAYPISSVPGLSVTAEARFISALNTNAFKRSGTLARTEALQNVSGLIGLRYAFGAPTMMSPAPAPVAVPAPAPARTYLVFFDWDKADLTARAKSIIAEAADASKKVATTTVDVSGHADKSGTAPYNKALSLRRAQAVAAEMVRLGVPEKEIVITAYGDTRPLVPTAAGVREPQNRRVEIVLK
jgi:outer membrane protein OmpA-like peptidoglycan-associated protein